MRVLRACLCLFAIVNSSSSTLPAPPSTPSPSETTGSHQGKPPKANSQPSAPGAPSQVPAKPQTQEQKIAAFQGRLAKIFDPSNVDLSDYVPCHFTVTELRQLRPAPPTSRLTGQEAEALKEQVEAEALAQEEAGLLDADSKTGFVTNVAQADLEGLTPSAALATIIALFRAADKAGAARRNPASIRGMYADNPLQGLAVLASVAPDGEPIGGDWADDVSRQAYSQGVKAAVRSKLTQDQAASLFQRFVSQDFVSGLAALPPAAALKAINDEGKHIQDEQKQEVATLQAKAASLPVGLDAGGAAAAADEAAKAFEQSKANATKAAENLQSTTQAASQVNGDLQAAENRARTADQARAAGQDPAAVKSLGETQQKAHVDLLDARKAWEAAQQKLLAAQKDAQQKSDAQDAAAKAHQLAQQQAADAKVPQDLKAAQQSEAATSSANKALAGASQPPASGAAAQAVVDSARSTIEAFKRPPDIGCAMSILSWNETRYEYGRLLANEYIGIQVVVRNLSETQEFIMHDSAFAVDTDLTGRKGRFFSGRDKLILRGMSAADADFSPRNLVVHMMEAVGTIMSAVIPVAGEAFGNASSVYNSGFLQGLHKTWADHNTDHLNLLNDTAFSSATAYKTVVPKSGSVMFVMFVPSKQFEQGWWAQPCAQTISNGILPNSTDPDGSNADDARAADPNSRSQGVKAEDQTGIDLQRARAACKLGGGEANVNSTDNPGIQPKLPNNATPFQIIHYKNWSGNALAVFRELAFTIVSGIHVNEAAQSNPGTSAVDCKEDTEGNVDFNEQSGGNLSCPVKGQNLDKVQKIRLRNSTDATDSKVAEGDVKVNGDATTATVSFPLAQIGPLEGAAYKVFLINKDGVESVGGQTLHFARTPFLTAPTPSPVTIDLGKDLDAKTHTKSIDLSGYHLDKLSGIHLEGSGIKLDFAIDKPSASKASFVFDGTKSQSDLEKAKKPLTLAITLTSTDKTHPTVPSKTEISISGTLQPPAPANPPAANGASTPGGAGTGGGSTPPPSGQKPPSKPKKPPSTP